MLTSVGHVHSVCECCSHNPGQLFYEGLSVLCLRTRPVLLATFLWFFWSSKEGQVVNERHGLETQPDILLVICQNFYGLSIRLRTTL